jgi:K+-transporting ATPase KdpF subunit
MTGLDLHQPTWFPMLEPLLGLAAAALLAVYLIYTLIRPERF